MPRPKLHIAKRELFCKNRCGFYGNPQWDGLCSKCYRELTTDQLAAAASVQSVVPSPVKRKVHDGRHATQSSPVKSQESLSSRQHANQLNELEDRKKSSRMTFFKKAKHKTSAVQKLSGDPAPAAVLGRSGLSPESAQVVRDLTDFLSSLSRQTADDVRRQIQTCVESCGRMSDVASTDQMSELVQNFYSSFQERINSSSIYQNVSAERRAALAELTERYLTTRMYRHLFVPLSQRLEEADLALQERIRSLHWVSAALLELTIDETDPRVRQLLENAITGLIEMDSKRTPQDKLQCVASSVEHLESMLTVAGRGETDGAGEGSCPPSLSADDMLPAIIYLVLRTNPTRLQSNVQYVTHFSSQERIMSGRPAYYFCHLCAVVSFISNISGESLGLTEDEFERYMRGDVLPPEVDGHSQPCQGLRTMKTNGEVLESLTARQSAVQERHNRLHESMVQLENRLSETVDTTLQQCPLRLRAPAPRVVDSASSAPAASASARPASETSGSSVGDPLLPAPPSALLLSDAQHSLSSLLALSQFSVPVAGAAAPTATAADGGCEDAGDVCDATPPAGAVRLAMRHIPSIACTAGGRAGSCSPSAASPAVHSTSSDTRRLSVDRLGSADSVRTTTDVITAAATNECATDAATPPTPRRQSADTLVRVLTGIFSITDHF